jgi:hypothetical protein
MSNVRYGILENLKAALAGITIANGYQSDVASASRQFESWENMTSEKFPALFLLDDGREEIEDIAGDWVIAIMYPTIVGYVRDKTDIALAFGKMDADIKKFLYSSPNLGSYAKIIAYQGYEAIFTIDDFVIFQLRPKIVYDFPKSDP